MITYCPHYKEAIEIFHKYFLNRFDVLPIYYSSRITVAKAHDDLLESHLTGKKVSLIEKSKILLLGKGQIKCGAYTPNTNSKTKYACIDFDGSGHSSPLEDPENAIIKTYLYASSLGIPSYIECSSGGKGYHLWIFFESPIDAIYARALCKAILPDDIKMKNGSTCDVLSNKGIEIFPKTNELGKGKVGNQVWLPWYYGASEKGSIFYSYKDELKPTVYTSFEQISEKSVIDIVNNFGGIDKIFKGKNLSYSVNLDKTNDIWKVWRSSVLENLSLELIYGDYYTGKTSGEWIECRDPWSQTGDQNPSSGVANGKGEIEKGTWHSFISSENLSVFDFIRKIGLTEDNHMSACRYLADVTGIDLPRTNNDNVVPITTLLTNPTPTNDDTPQIVISNRQLRDIVDDCWTAVQHYNNLSPRLFVKAGQLVNVNEMEDPPSIHMLTESEVYGILSRAANWIKITNTGVINVLPLDKAARDMVCSDHPGKQNVPKLETVVTTPVFSHKKELIIKPGYNECAKVWYKPSLTVPEIPKSPTEEDVEAAKRLIEDDLFVNFPFCTEGDLAHSYAALLLPFVRQLIDGPTPLHIVEAPGPGTGKGKLCNLISIISTGEACEARSLPSTDEEIRKMITAELIQSKTIILLDNASEKKKLDSASLAVVLTSVNWKDRILKESRMLSLTNFALWMLTANNPKFSMEIARRCVRIRLDAKVEQPWKRKAFKHPYPEEWAKENRSILVRAVLILVQNWVVKGCPHSENKLGSFERWSAIIGGILEVNNIRGFLGNLDEIYEHSDKEGLAWRGLVAKWSAFYQETPVDIQDLYRLCESNGLMIDVIGEGPERVRINKLQEALNTARDRVVLEYKLISLNTGQYKLEDLNPSRPHNIPTEDPDKPSTPKKKAKTKQKQDGYFMGSKVNENSEKDELFNL